MKKDDARPLPPAHHVARMVVLAAFVGLATAAVTFAVATGTARDLFDWLHGLDRAAGRVWDAFWPG